MWQLVVSNTLSVDQINQPMPSILWIPIEYKSKITIMYSVIISGFVMVSLGLVSSHKATNIPNKVIN